MTNETQIVTPNPSMSYEVNSQPVPVAPQPVKPPRRYPYGRYIALFFAVLFVLVLIAGIASRITNTNQGQVLPTTTPAPPVTSHPLLTAIATTSAFMKFDADVASLSAIINTFSIDDPTLTAPVVDLDLGIPQ